MARQPQSRGTCTYCGQVVAKGGVGKHLAACDERRAAIAKAEDGGGAETLLHLRVQDEASGAFWLDLEMRGSATLKQLDAYLRAIWLECCGHLSRFSAGRWDGQVGMQRRAEDVFGEGVTLTHTYDFGSSSYTLVKLAGTRTGAPTTKRPIALLARNLMPEAACIRCGEPATVLCMECLIEKDVWGTLCDDHARKHGHHDYGPPVPLVNSPRVGICGYTGPADPPY